jgi:hypothetical protein
MVPPVNVAHDGAEVRILDLERSVGHRTPLTLASRGPNPRRPDIRRGVSRTVVRRVADAALE